MRTVTVKKNDLAAVLNTNLTNHRAEFFKAAQGYRDYMVKELDVAIAKLTAGELVELRFDYDKPPKNHSNEYESALKMLEMSVDDTIELSHDDFRQLVMDDWEWQRNWKLSNFKYISR